MEVYEYYVAECFLPAIFNNDYTGLDDEEERLLDAFLDEVREVHGDGHWSFPDDDESFFGLDEVTGLYADCHTLQYVVLED